LAWLVVFWFGWIFVIHVRAGAFILESAATLLLQTILGYRIQIPRMVVKLPPHMIDTLVLGCFVSQSQCGGELGL
jgi:hypothetical protein